MRIHSAHSSSFSAMSLVHHRYKTFNLYTKSHADSLGTPLGTRELDDSTTFSPSWSISAGLCSSHLAKPRRRRRHEQPKDRVGRNSLETQSTREELAGLSLSIMFPRKIPPFFSRTTR